MKISMRELLESGAHLGIEPDLEPKMAPYIFGARNQTIINLEKPCLCLTMC